MKEWFKKVKEWVGIDGMLHFCVSALLMFALGWIRPLWIALVIVAAIGIGKEIYDYISRKGTAEWKDLVCDLAGIAFGTLAVWLNLLAK